MSIHLDKFEKEKRLIELHLEGKLLRDCQSPNVI